jgi:hypothetical protein
MNRNILNTLSLEFANLKTAEVAPGSIIADVIIIQVVIKDPNEPRSVAIPISIPFIRMIETAHDMVATTIIVSSAAFLLLICPYY